MIDITNEVIGGLVVTAVGAALTKLYSELRKNYLNKFTKFTYYRIIRIRFKDRGDTPYYVRHHHSIDGDSEPVYDEALVFNGVHSPLLQKIETITLSSKGMVDAIQVMPTLDSDSNNHPHGRKNRKQSQFSYSHRCNQLAAIGTYINGLQDPSEWWYATTAQHEHQTLFLVLDFTSLGYETCPVTNVTSSLERNKHVVPKHMVEDQWIESHLGPDLFHLKFKNAKKGDVIKFTFLINKDLIPVSGAQGKAEHGKGPK